MCSAKTDAESEAIIMDDDDTCNNAAQIAFEPATNSPEKYTTERCDLSK